MAARRDTIVRAALIGAATASVGLFAAGGDAPQVPAAVPAAPAERAPVREESLRADLLNRGTHAFPTRDVFAAHSWQPPAPAPVAAKVQPAPPPPPQAPPLPFTFLGSFATADGKSVHYLVRGERVLLVSEGDTVEGVYRIEAVTPAAMELTYLPLAIGQTLPLGDAK